MPPRSFPLLKYLDEYAENESTGEIRAEGKTLKNQRIAQKTLVKEDWGMH